MSVTKFRNVRGIFGIPVQHDLSVEVSEPEWCHSENEAEVASSSG